VVCLDSSTAAKSLHSACKVNPIWVVIDLANVATSTVLHTREEGRVKTATLAVAGGLAVCLVSVQGTIIRAVVYAAVVTGVQEVLRHCLIHQVTLSTDETATTSLRPILTHHLPISGHLFGRCSVNIV
jgi:hypothetical protein